MILLVQDANWHWVGRPTENSTLPSGCTACSFTSGVTSSLTSLSAYVHDMSHVWQGVSGRWSVTPGVTMAFTPLSACQCAHASCARVLMHVHVTCGAGSIGRTGDYVTCVALCTLVVPGGVLNQLLFHAQPAYRVRDRQLISHVTAQLC